MEGKGDALAVRLMAASRRLGGTERAVLLAMLDDEATYLAVAERLGISAEAAQAVFAAALVTIADALDAPPPGAGVQRCLRKIAAWTRLARRWSPR